MEKLTNKEEEIMHILWKLEKAFVKDVLNEIQEEKPHYNTLSTIIRNIGAKTMNRTIFIRQTSIITLFSLG